MSSKNNKESQRDHEESTFIKIGEFIFWFSQLELALRGALSDALRLPHELFDTVTASYDFRTLCDVTLAACQFRCQDETTGKAMVDVINRAKQVNDTRVRIAHGTWMPSSSGGLNAMHMSRQSLKSRYFFDSPGELQKAVDQCIRVAQDAIWVAGGSLDASIPQTDPKLDPG